MSDDPAQSLIDASNGPHKIPFLTPNRLRFIWGLSRDIFKMISFLNDEWIFDIGVGYAHNDDSPAHTIRKIDSFA
jgi:hypothetical protein